MTNNANTNRRLIRTSDRSFDVVVDGVKIGGVWAPGTPGEQGPRPGKVWRANNVDGNEIRPWYQFETPQLAAAFVVTMAPRVRA